MEQEFESYKLEPRPQRRGFVFYSEKFSKWVLLHLWAACKWILKLVGELTSNIIFWLFKLAVKMLESALTKAAEMIAKLLILAAAIAIFLSFVAGGFKFSNISIETLIEIFK